MLDRGYVVLCKWDVYMWHLKRQSYVCGMFYIRYGVRAGDKIYSVSNPDVSHKAFRRSLIACYGPQNQPLFCKCKDKSSLGALFSCEWNRPKYPPDRPEARSACFPDIASLDLPISCVAPRLSGGVGACFTPLNRHGCHW